MAFLMLPVLAAAGTASDDGTPQSLTEGNRYQPAITSPLGIVSTMTDEAAAVGVSVLDQGGNAIDAAIATAFAESVVVPQYCGIGGSGVLVYRQANGDSFVLDFEPRLPLAATPEFYANATFAGHRLVAVPGMVAGMHAAYERHGSRAVPWEDLIVSKDPQSRNRAEGLAENGITVGREFTVFSGLALSTAPFPETRETFLVDGLVPYQEGMTLVQADLAATLRLIAKDGPDAFYRGEIARLIVSDMENASSTTRNDPRAQLEAGAMDDAGILSLQDLAEYEAVWRDPLVRSYRDAKIIAPSGATGGLTVLEMLNILEGYPIGEPEGPAFSGDPRNDRDWSVLSANVFHAIAEAERIAWKDRLAHIGDPAYVDVPVGRLLSPKYGEEKRAEIEWRAGETGVGEFQPGTCSLSVIDSAGNAVALTFSVGDLFGSRVVAPGTGFVLNGQIHASEVTDGGWVNNQIAPGKRVALSHSPVIVVRGQVPVLAVGAFGGALIPQGVLQSIVNVVDFRMDVAHAVDAPRIEALFGEAYSKDCAADGVEVALWLEAIGDDQPLRTTQGRVPKATQDELLARLQARSPDALICRPSAGQNSGHEMDDYYDGPLGVRAAGIDPATGLRVGSSDMRAFALRGGPTEEVYHWGVAGQVQPPAEPCATSPDDATHADIETAHGTNPCVEVLVAVGDDYVACSHYVEGINQWGTCQVP